MEPPAAAPTPVANTTLLTDPLPTADPEAWLCGVDPRVSLDWGEWTAASATTTDYELIADTGANVHISPDRSDFVTFTEIAPRPIKGFQGSAINATGIGTVAVAAFQAGPKKLAKIAVFGTGTGTDIPAAW
ncbi:hypothetical protein B0H15DRAFT_1009915 [Mycena belliarum]|uniref:Retrovirus-related Pol polyprotein from transposon TNT 1-94-like beta-barrel domain-containing protein n=1 Tax=Mycena belliarum TaxID=1033014 RepID=A0AAD6UBT0_9AGAR|nr:hypothetical protein B0H15DRAFT_1009915 [Mycena belliae]